MSFSLWIPKETKLLVTSRIHYELDAASEVWHALKATGICDNAHVSLIKKGREWIRGLIAFSFNNDPYTAIRAVKGYFLKRPWIMEFTERIIPIEYVSNHLNNIINYVAEKVINKIRVEDRWKIEVFKHSTKYKKKKIIEKVAEEINIGKVDLEKPDWIILINAIKTTLTASIIQPDQIIRKKEIMEMTDKKELTI